MQFERAWLRSLGVGLLLGVAFFELLPHAILGGIVASAAAGIVFGFFLVWKVMEKEHVTEGAVLFGFYVHAIIEGAVVATTFSVGIAAGIAAFIGFLLHELPEFAALFSVLAGLGKNLEEAISAQIVGLLLALLSLVLVLVFLEQIPQIVKITGLAAAAGAFFFLGADELVQIARKRDGTRAGWMALGVFVLFLLQTL